MPHIFEPASTNRSKCRGCKQGIAKGMLRFGESLPNQFGEGEVTHWFHPACAAYKRPEPLLEALQAAADVPDRDAGPDAALRGVLEQRARATLEHHRLQRIDGAERSPTSQAKCRQCKEPIEKGSWRLRLIFHEEGTFSPGGFVHLACRKDYFETDGIVEQVLHFSPALDEDARAELTRDLS